MNRLEGYVRVIRRLICSCGRVFSLLAFIANRYVLLGLVQKWRGVVDGLVPFVDLGVEWRSTFARLFEFRA